MNICEKMADVEKAKIEFLSNYARDLMVMNMQLTNQVMTFEYVKMFLTVIVVICFIFFLYYYFTCSPKQEPEKFMPYITTLQHEIKRSDPDFDKGYRESLMEQKEWRNNEDFLFDDLRSQEEPYDFNADYYR
jgi:hypothetical protein